MALTTLFDLQKSGKRADQETWDMLIELCAAVGKWDAALEIIRDIFAEEVGPELFVAGILRGVLPSRASGSWETPLERMRGVVVAGFLFQG